MEEIEELRAKAIASMPSSANPNLPTTAIVCGGEGGACRNSEDPNKSREEGEVSSSDDVELATCSVTPTNMTNLDEPMRCTLRNNPINEVKRAPTAHLRAAGIQIRPSLLQNHQKLCHKHFKRKQFPFRSLSNQALHWSAKESKNNLVISFSDDSGSDTEGCSSEKDVKRIDHTSLSCDSRIAVTSLPKLTDGMERELNGIKQTSQNGFTNHAANSTVNSTYEASSRPQETSTENDPLLHRKMPTVRASSSWELVHGQGSSMADERLEFLRNQIASRENQLKLPNKPVLEKGSTIGSDSNEYGLHAMKEKAQVNSIRRHADDATSEFVAVEPSKKRLKHDKSSIILDFNASCHPENEITFNTEPCHDHQHVKNAVKSCTFKCKDPFSVLSAANDRSLSGNDDVGRFMRSEKFSKRVEVSNLPLKHASSMHAIKGKQLLISTTDISSPMEAFSMYERPSDLRSENKGIHTSQLNIKEKGGIPFDHLVNLEDLLDKELEEAQEHRCKCELEERNALIAYRQAQRALVEANERCSLLYGKREIFSAKFRAFLMEASNCICPPNWLCQQNPHEDQLYEPDASTSVDRDNGALDVVVPPVHNPNMLTDDDGEDFNKVVESGSPHVDTQIEKAHSFGNSQDYELLEASLRSELVARLGLRESSKVNDTNKKGLDVEKTSDVEAEYIDASLLPPHKVLPSSEMKQTAKFGVGFVKAKESSSLLSAPIDFPLLVNVSSNELQRIADLDTNYSMHKESDKPTYTAAFSLPSSDLHKMCKHTYMFFPGCNAEAFSIKGNDYVMTVKEMESAHFVPDIDIIGEVINFTRHPPQGYKDFCGTSVKIDPFWPLCMFEFRGKCNDEECPWQHMKTGMSLNLQKSEHSDVPSICLPNEKSDASRFPSNVIHTLPIPTYQIGQYLIKADSNHSHSVLAQSNWQYKQREFCTSFSIPFSVQRILPLDTPCLQSGDDPVADYYNWNRISRYCQNGALLFMEQIKRGSYEVEQSLEMALVQSDGEFCESDRMKALSLLAHAIESYPSSVLLWVVYLHIYYRNEKDLGKDDMFLHAVRHNKSSYELWLLYINSRLLCEDRLIAYDRALDVLCHMGSCDATKHFSCYILDIFLQMVNFLCMCEHVDKAVSRICELLPSDGFKKSCSNPLPDIWACLTVSDRCLFWVSCIYFIVYEKLPEAIVQQLELVKNLSFKWDWPSAQVTPDREEVALNFMKLGMAEMSSHFDDNPKEIDQASLESLHFLAVSHVKCAAAFQSSPGYQELLVKYLKSYPSCTELVLMRIRSHESYASGLKFTAFEEAIYHWPEETPGTQRLWNQFAECALSNHRIDLAEKLMARWYQDFREFRVLGDRTPSNEKSLGSSSHTDSTCAVRSKTNDDAFGFLNLCLYWMLHASLENARSAIDRALEVASPRDYVHFVMEHALFVAATDTKSHWCFPGGTLSTLLNRYLADPRSCFQLEPLSRQFIQTIKKPRIQQMVKSLLGPISMGSTLVNSVMEVFNGQKFHDVKATVSFVEYLMEMAPTNCELALSVYKTCSRNFRPARSDCNSLKFWACCLLINSIFQSAPVAPEHIWLEAANVLTSSESIEVTLRFHKQAISVYPFSVKLWRSYAHLYTAINGDASEIIEAAQERGIELSNIVD